VTTCRIKGKFSSKHSIGALDITKKIPRWKFIAFNSNVFSMPSKIRPIPRIGSFLTYMIIYHKFITLANNVHFTNQMISYDVLLMFWPLTCTLIHII